MISIIRNSVVATIAIFCFFQTAGSQDRKPSDTEQECNRIFADKNPGPAFVKLELRLAETSPAADLDESVVACDGMKVYLYRQVLITNEDIAEASVVSTQIIDGYMIGLRLTDTATVRMSKATTDSIGKRMAIILDGKVWSAPTIQSGLSRDIYITGMFTKERAERFVAALKKR